MMNALLQIQLSPNDGFRGRGRIGLEGETASSGPTILTDIISTAIGVMTIIAIIWFVFILLTGALGVMGAGDDKAKTAQARGRIASGLTGLVIVFSAVAIISLIGFILGVPNILFLNQIILELINQS